MTVFNRSTAREAAGNSDEVRSSVFFPFLENTVDLFV